MPPESKSLVKKAFPLRLDPALYAAIERAAAGDFRSVNAQVEVLLREALERRGVKVAVSAQPKRGRPPLKEGSGYE
jgi:hypothetical protein